MIRKSVWQYCCEYCGKKKYSAGHMAHHEKHCTMNPNRKCGMCSLTGNSGPQLTGPEMVALLPDKKQFEKKMFRSKDEVNGFFGESEWTEYPGLKNAVVEKLQDLRDKTDNCPACILSALRQSGINRYLIPGVFEYELEKKDFFDELRENDPEY
jgi:hypothetical protein